MAAASHKVTKCASMAQALQHLAADTFDLIISDCSMPDMDGCQFFRKVRANPESADLPFLFVSATLGLQARTEALHLHADGYLPKPFDVNAFIALVDETISL